MLIQIGISVTIVPLYPNLELHVRSWSIDQMEPSESRSVVELFLSMVETHSALPVLELSADGTAGAWTCADGRSTNRRRVIARLENGQVYSRYICRTDQLLAKIQGGEQ